MMISIGNKKIGFGEPCFIIAEAGVNHNGDPDCARKLIDAAVEAQADAIKFQTFIAEILVTPSAQKAEYQKIGSSASTTQFQMLKSLELSEPVFKKLAAYAKKKGILFLSTAFDEESLALGDDCVDHRGLLCAMEARRGGGRTASIRQPCPRQAKTLGGDK